MIDAWMHADLLRVSCSPAVQTYLSTLQPWLLLHVSMHLSRSLLTYLNTLQPWLLLHVPGLSFLQELLVTSAIAFLGKYRFQAAR